MGIISGSIWGSFQGWGSFRGRDHFGGCTVSKNIVAGLQRLNSAVAFFRKWSREYAREGCFDRHVINQILCFIAWIFVLKQCVHELPPVFTLVGWKHCFDRQCRTTILEAGWTHCKTQPVVQSRTKQCHFFLDFAKLWRRHVWQPWILVTWLKILLLVFMDLASTFISSFLKQFKFWLPKNLPGPFRRSKGGCSLW